MYCGLPEIGKIKNQLVLRYQLTFRQSYWIFLELQLNK